MARITEIEALERRLARSKAQINALIAEIEAKPDGIDCAENTMRVMAPMLPAPVGLNGKGKIEERRQKRVRVATACAYPCVQATTARKNGAAFSNRNSVSPMPLTLVKGGARNYPSLMYLRAR